MWAILTQAVLIQPSRAIHSLDELHMEMEQMYLHTYPIGAGILSLQITVRIENY